MTRYAVLLRAVNLGRGGRVSMPQWRAALTEAGCADVRTYLNSGNAVVSSDLSSAALAAQVREDLAERFAVRTEVVVRTRAQLDAAIRDNPFPDAEATPTNLHVAFLGSRPSPASVAALDPQRYAPDVFAVAGDVIYLRYANGSGRSKLTLAAFDSLKVAATARNWRTVLALAAMAQG